MANKIRSLRISEDIFEEMMRIRLPGYGVGEQKTWDQLFNYFLILHHGDGDWRNNQKRYGAKKNV